MTLSDGLYFGASLICLVFLIYRPFKRFHITRERVVITFLLINIFLTGVVSVAKSYLIFKGIGDAGVVSKIESFLYFMLHNLLAPAFALYIFYITGEAKNKGRWFYVFFLTPMVITEILVILTPFLDIVYRYDLVDGVPTYSRSWGVLILYVVGVLYLIIPTISLIKTWKILSNKYMFGFQLFLVLVVIGIAIQAVYSKLQIEAILEAIGVVGIITSVDSNEGLFDSVTKIPNRDKYKINISLYHKYGYHYSIINVRILNLYYYDNILLSSDKDNMMKRITKKLFSVAPRAEIYKYDRSTFIVLIPGKEDHKNIFTQITRFFSHTMYVSGVNVDFQTVVSYARAPKEIKFPEAHFRLAEYAPNNQKRMTILRGDALQFLRKNIWIQEAVQRSIKEKSFMIHYQPIWDVDSKKIVSFEALCRLKDAELGLIPPAEFIKIAEDTGNIIELGDVILEKVCRDITDFHFEKAGIRYVEVNLSLYQLMSQDIVGKLKRIVEANHIKPSMLNLEITETSSVLDVSNFKYVINELLTAGFTLSLDDYGTAYSNITNAISTNYLNIKIDSSILWKAKDDKNTMKLLETTIKTFRSFGSNIVQEGVETRAQYDVVTAAGANLIQGYFISKPLPVAEAIEFARTFRDLKKE